MVEAKETAAQPDAEMNMVQLGVEPEVQLQDGARRSTDKRFSAPERDPATKRRGQDDMDDGPNVRRVDGHFMGTPDSVMALVDDLMDDIGSVAPMLGHKTGTAYEHALPGIALGHKNGHCL